MGSDRTGGARRELLMTIEEAEALLALQGWQLKIHCASVRKDQWYYDVSPIGEERLVPRTIIRNSAARSKAQAQIVFIKWMHDGCPVLKTTEDDLKQYGREL